MSSKKMMWFIITIVAIVFQYIGVLIFGGGIFGLWNNVFGFIGCFVGLWLWYKYLREL